MSSSFSARGLRVVGALTIASLVACGGGAPTTTRSASLGTDPANRAYVAARATDPRTGDPTAAPAPLPASQGSASVTAPASSPSGGPPASFGAAQPAPSSDPTGAAAAPPSSEAASATDVPSAKRDAEPPKRIGARHVLIQWMGAERAPDSVVRSRDQAYAVAQQVLKRAKAGEDFARLAIEFSDEPGAGARGGSLGRFGRGQMVPAFEEAAFKLEVGQISDIVESPFGYHIIQRTE